jgi:hypothetical protein
MKETIYLKRLEITKDNSIMRNMEICTTLTIKSILSLGFDSRMRAAWKVTSKLGNITNVRYHCGG